MSENWFYAQGQTQRGPVPFATLQQLAASGGLSPTDLVWTDGMAQWSPASTVTGLFAQAAATPTAIPPVAASPAIVGYYTPTDFQYEYVGFWWRVLAYIIDYFAMLIPGFILGFITGFTLFMAMGDTQSTEALVQVITNIMGIIIGWLYYALMESSKTQGTLGKMAIGVRVIDMEGRRLTFGKATGRFFGKIVSGIILLVGFMMVGWTQKKQGLHDMMAGTLVVKGRPTA